MNIIPTSSGHFLSAGQHQFRSLWTRDFCFSIRSLLEIGREDVVKNHLTRLIESRRPSDGLVPRVLDSVSPRLRVIAACAFPSKVRETVARPFLKPLNEPLRPEYVDEHGSEAIDSNLLVLIAAFQYYKHTNDETWFTSMMPSLEEVWKFYQRRRRGAHGPILQGAFSDWQDSLNRSGYTLYTNVLLYNFLQSAADYGIFGVLNIEPRNFRSQTLAEFYWPAKRLWRSEISPDQERRDRLCLDYHLLGLECGMFGTESSLVYSTLKNSELWLSSPRGLPGFNSTTRYPTTEKTWAVRIAGLDRYHEDLYWSWLLNLAARVSLQMGDPSESERINSKIFALYERDQTVFEVYDPRNMKPFRSRLYSSEFPFSWGC